MYFDSFHNICSEDLLAIQNYCSYTENRLQSVQASWNILATAGHCIERQADGVSCGVYCMMIPDCLIRGVDISLLTPTTIIDCRKRIAQALLDQSLPDIIITSSIQHNSDLNEVTVNLRTTDSSTISPHYPPLLQRNYDWKPTVIHNLQIFTFYAPALSEPERDTLQEACSHSNTQLQIGSRYLAHEDFMDLLSPTALVNDVVDILITLMLTPYNDVTYFSVGVTQEFVRTTNTTTGSVRLFRRLHHESSQLNSSREKLLQSGRIVFTFLDSEHYTTVIVNNTEKCIYYMDSIRTRPSKKPWEIDMVINLILDEAAQRDIHSDINCWPIHYPTSGMIPQVAYCPDDVHHDLSRHIDCGLYAALMTTMVLSHQPLSALLPAQVHKFRTTAALILWTNAMNFDVGAHIKHTTDIQPKAARR